MLVFERRVDLIFEIPMCGAADNRAAQNVPYPNPLPTGGEGIGKSEGSNIAPYLNSTAPGDRICSSSATNVCVGVTR